MVTVLQGSFLELELVENKTLKKGRWSWASFRPTAAHTRAKPSLKRWRSSRRAQKETFAARVLTADCLMDFMIHTQLSCRYVKCCTSKSRLIGAFPLLLRLLYSVGTYRPVWRTYGQNDSRFLIIEVSAALGAACRRNFLIVVVLIFSYYHCAALLFCHVLFLYRLCSLHVLRRLPLLS